MYKVHTKLDTGRSDEEAGWDESDTPNGDYGVHEFATKAEALAFMQGVNVACEATHGWTEGWLEATLISLD